MQMTHVETSSTATHASVYKYSVEYLQGLHNCGVGDKTTCSLPQLTCLFLQSNKLNSKCCNIHHLPEPHRKKSRRGTRAGKSKTFTHQNIKFANINALSVKNKTTKFVHFVIDNKLDIVAITETWIKPEDTVVIGDITPHGYLTCLLDI